MAPFPLEEILGRYGAYLIYLLIGIGFGAVLEMSGFGDSRRLAAQFYLKDQTVLKVMFTAIVTAMVLIFGASALGLLDYNRLWVNPTYLVPGIVGGLIMGVGFIIGGFCPGTSLVASATLKLDGIFFLLGASTGIFLFGETVESWLGPFWYSTYLGRYTLQDWMGVDAGVVVFLVVLFALFAFWGAGKLEAIFGGLFPSPSARRYQRIGAVALAAAALFVMLVGQPTAAEKWKWIAAEKEPLLKERKVQIEPGELLSLMHDDQLNLILLDVRDEAAYNLFHLIDARRVSMEELESESLASALISAPNPTVIVLVDQDEKRATEAWKLLTGQGVLNVYLLEGGIERWLDTFCREAGESGNEAEKEAPCAFHAALGDRYPWSDPDPEEFEDLHFTRKVEIQKRKPITGGCG